MWSFQKVGFRALCLWINLEALNLHLLSWKLHGLTIGTFCWLVLTVLVLLLVGKSLIDLSAERY